MNPSAATISHISLLTQLGLLTPQAAQQAVVQAASGAMPGAAATAGVLPGLGSLLVSDCL